MKYLPSRRWAWVGAAFLCAAAAAGWAAWTRPGAALVAAVLLLASLPLILLGAQPPVEARDGYLRVGRRAIAWNEIRDVHRAAWRSLVLVRLTTAQGRKVRLVFTGNLSSAARLLRHICRSATTATIDGRPYQEFWGEVPVAPRPAATAPPRFRLLRPEDEAEVERMYQRLKSVGRLDSARSSDET
jgi:hypothetical protein